MQKEYQLTELKYNKCILNDMQSARIRKPTVLRGWPNVQSVAALNYQVLTDVPALAMVEHMQKIA